MDARGLRGPERAARLAVPVAGRNLAAQGPAATGRHLPGARAADVPGDAAGGNGPDSPGLHQGPDHDPDRLQAALTSRSSNEGPRRIAALTPLIPGAGPP